MEPYTVKSDEYHSRGAMEALNTNPAATRPHLTACHTTFLRQPAFVTSSAPSSHTSNIPAQLPGYFPPISTPVTAANATAAADCSIENVKLHPFDVNDPSIWIYQVESIFRR
jgi:hypothetical protein